MTDRPFRDEPTEVLKTALGLADTHAQQAARFQPVQPGDELTAVSGLFRAELQHREGSVTSNCPNCQHPEHLPGTECNARIDHGPSRFHACLCLARPGAANACPPQMTCQGGTLGYADIWYLQHGHTLSSADGVISPEVLADGPASAATPPVPDDADLRTLIRGVIRDCPALYPDDIADRVWAALQSAYRRLLARLEADRAGHLRAAGQATEELLRIDGAVSASTLRHAAAMAVRAFEGPDAAQAYMQRTEGDPVTAVDADLRDRIEVWPLKRVLAEVQCGSRDWTWEEEWADLDRRHAETGYLAKLEQQIRENGITMPVLIGSDGRLWDGHHRLRIAVRLGIDYVPVEITPSAEACRPFDAQAGLQRLADDLQQAECACDPAPHRQLDGTYSHLAGCPVADAEQFLDERVAAAKEQQAGEGR